MSSTTTGPSSPKELYAEFALPPGSHSIRLFDLQAVPPGRDDYPLAGHLRVQCLRDQPEFTTLSYVWDAEHSVGSTISSHPHGIDLPITDSCFQALRHIRKQAGAVTIWVDSICINQADDAEKESQIPLMQQIYSCASVGYIWLGEGSPELYAAIDELEALAMTMKGMPLAYMAAASKKMQKWELRQFWWRNFADIPSMQIVPR